MASVQLNNIKKVYPFVSGEDRKKNKKKTDILSTYSKQFCSVLYIAKNNLLLQKNVYRKFRRTRDNKRN